MVKDNDEFRKAITRCISEETKKHPDLINATIGLEFADCDIKSRTAKYVYRKKPNHLNPYGGVHGGVIAALLDECIGVTGIAACGSLLMTTDMTTSYLRGMTEDEYVITAELTKVGNTMVRGIGKIYEASTGKLSATAMASYMAIVSE